MTIGECILLRRKALGLTQGELAKTVKVDETTIRRWEKGRSTPTANQVNMLAQALNTAVACLLGETNDLSPRSEASPLVDASSATVNAPIAAAAGRDHVTATTTPQTGALDLPDITQFAVQLKAQGDKDKMKDAIDIFKSSIAMLERAVATA